MSNNNDVLQINTGDTMALDITKTPKTPSSHLTTASNTNTNINTTSLHTPASLSSPSTFYIEDSDEDEKEEENLTPKVRKSQMSLLKPLEVYNSSLPTSPTKYTIPMDLPSSEPSLFMSTNDIFSFPTESTNAYSYAHLSPNSLALRLNVLKRSLEILIDRPSLLTSVNSFSKNALANSGVSPPDTPINNTFHLFYSKDKLKKTPKRYIDNSLSPSDGGSIGALSPGVGANLESQIKIETNASSAALAAFFRSSSTTKRATSLQVPFLMNQHRINNDALQYYKSPRSSDSDLTTSDVKKATDEESEVIENIRDKLKSMIKFLSDPNSNLLNHTSPMKHNSINDGDTMSDSESQDDDGSGEMALNLHNLSLSNVNDEMKEKLLQKKLLYALATPFYESISANNINNLDRNISSVALNQNSTNYHAAMSGSSQLSKNGLPSRAPLKKFNSFDDSVIKNTTTSRPFHSLSTSKNMTPQAIFTCEIDEPWDLRAANDLSRLIFGLNKTSIKELNLLDLIAPNSKDFVYKKLVKNLKSREFGNYKDILFAGEIVAISDRGSNAIQWCSLWAKKKNNIIILMFDKIPCNAFDLEIAEIGNTFTIVNRNEVTGKLLAELIEKDQADLKNVSKSLDEKMSKADSIDEISRNINDTRYFTLQMKGTNLPCAVLSQPRADSVLLKIHTLPYIAGIFIISANNYKILSYNRSIAKNLFGYGDLLSQPINKIIPNFTKFLEIATSTKKLAAVLQDVLTKSTPERFRENPGKTLLPGLVLPEHFFRKIQAKFLARKVTEMRNNSINENEEWNDMMHSTKTEDQIEEELFLKSKGISGKHRDGSQLCIDVQLRVSSIDTLVLWVTYTNEKVSKANDAATIVRQASLKRSNSLLNSKKVKFNQNKLGSEKSASSNSSVRTRNSSSTLNVNSNNLNDFEIEMSSKASSSSLVSLKYASANDHKSNTLLSDLSEINKTQPKLEPSFAVDGFLIETDDSGSANGIKNIIVTDTSEPSSVGNKMLEDLIKLEKERFAKFKSKCSLFPEVIGHHRRTKSVKEFKVIKQMGEGSYGKVQLVSRIDDPEYLIILKAIYKERILIDTWVRDRKLGTIPSEIQIMSFLNQFDHPNILRVWDFFEDDKCYYVEIPIHGQPPAIDLFDFIEIKKNLVESEIKFIFRQIVSAIKHLHEHGLVHRDIKDENIIIDENSFIKLIDFGSSAYVSDGPFDVFVGTMEYAPPEVLNGDAYAGPAQDVWSLGILLYTMIYKENPFYNVDDILEGELRVPFILSPGSINLIVKILQRDITKRPTCEEIYNDPWLQSS